MSANRGIEIFGPDSRYGLNVIERANRQARAERWNAPQVSYAQFFAALCPILCSLHNKMPDIGPTKIDIKVATEIEGDIRNGHRSTMDMDISQKMGQDLPM